MEVNNEEVEVEVRTLNGKSARVLISADKTVSDLKLVLASSSSLASSNFHLFFRGVKLNLKNYIHTLDLKSGEFLVLVPYTKKDQSRTQNSEVSSSAVPERSSISGFADAAYSEIMHDLSYLSSETNDSGRGPCKEGHNSFTSSECKRKRGFDNYDDKCEEEIGVCSFLWSVVQSPHKSILDQQNCEKFMGVLESLNCLRVPQSGTCFFLAARYVGGVSACGNDTTSCLCPAWLKRIMEAFSFVNIFSGFLQMQKEAITSASVKDAMKRLGKFGFTAGFEEIEYLSILCPKVVSFSNKNKPAKCIDSIVIINTETEESNGNEKCPRDGPKANLLSRIFSGIKKRETSLRTALTDAFNLLMRKSGNIEAVLVSVDDLLRLVSEGGIDGSANEAKRSRKSKSSSSSSSCKKRCCATNPLLAKEMVQHLREGIGSKGQMVHVEDIGARKATYVEMLNDLSENIKSTLKGMGITKLYSHQAEAILATLAGKNVVVATMTSSGKSLCYNVPVLEVLSQNFSSCALYLFPTKALAQDQLRALLEMTEGFDERINIGVYDGDTSRKERECIRTNARLLITNPDMLHMSILPYHGEFSRILSNLRFVVIDEAHAYKGTFGCHTALVLRRLRRLCSHVYGSDPSFIFSTATSANPREHCMELASLSELELIKNDGSPSSEKLFVMWNPSTCQTVLKASENEVDVDDLKEKGLSPISEVSHLFAEMVQHGLKCIAFCRSRKLAEIILSYTREILEETAPHLVHLIHSYRAGYVAEERRKIEREFFSGKLCGIAATNALELGIDVGHVDVTLHLGFPGSIASLWQQAGRSGRRERPSLAVYVAFGGPLDQYFMKFPKKLFNSSVECCHIDAQNPQVLEQHLACAALEHPLSLHYDEKYFGSGFDKGVSSLKSRRELISNNPDDIVDRIWSYIGREKKPSRKVSIRAIENDKYEVVDMKDKKVIEEIEESRAFFQVYDGAVYMNQGRTYLVKELRVLERVAFCHEAKLRYYTKTRDYTDIHVVGGNIAYPAGISKNKSLQTTAKVTPCKVTTTWFGFYKIQKGSNKIIDAVDLSLPKYSYESKAAWIQVPQSIKVSVEEKNFNFRGGLHAACHALLNVAPLFIRCDSSDLAAECSNPHDTRYFPERILVYDQRPGGTGVSMQIQPHFTELLTVALDLLTSCQCFGDAGCPNCVQSLVCHEYNEDIHKEAAVMIIKGVLEAEKSYFGEPHDSTSDCLPRH